MFDRENGPSGRIQFRTGERTLHQLDPSDRITATIPEFRRLSGIGRSRIYDLLNTGELQSVYVGTRRLILNDSYRQLLARLKETSVLRPHSLQSAHAQPKRRGQP